MAIPASPISRREELDSEAPKPLLEPGDRLSRSEFERRYERMPHVKKAELIEGIVYMPSPTRARKHAKPHLYLAAWLGAYEAETPGVECFANTTLRLDLENELQPDLVLVKSVSKGGHARISRDDYVEGPPELAVEIVGSSQAYDLHQKKGAYRRNGVREYLTWITTEDRIVWWELMEEEYQTITPEEGMLKSRVFPGLWLDTSALRRSDLKAVLTTLRHGLDSPEHRSFAAS